MSVKSKRRYLCAAAWQAKVPAWRQVLAGLAILGLYVQLVAAGLCAAASSAAADLTDFPICHTDISDGKSPAPASNHAPASQHSCPFCAIHCHAAVAVAPAVGAVADRVTVATHAQHTVAVAPTFARFFASASPRGPPALA